MINSIKQAEKVLALANENVLVVFDIDRTLLKEKGGADATFSSGFEPVENDTIEVIKMLQERGVPVIALTASTVAQSRAEDLSQVGIDLRSMFVPARYVFKPLPENPRFHPTLYHGVLCSGRCSKGAVLDLFITHCCRVRVNRVVFFDDNSKNCCDVWDKM